MKILEAVGSSVAGIFDFFEAFLSAGYGASYGGFNYQSSGRGREYSNKEIERELKRRMKQRYHNLIYKLKKSGLIEEKLKNNKKFFILTAKGKEKISFLKQRSKARLPEYFYSKEKSDKFTIIIFDIPEKEKRKRNWLRAVLGNLGFKMVQKSVWIGKIKVPKEFLDDLFNLKLIDFVEIFEISKTGSLKQIT